MSIGGGVEVEREVEGAGKGGSWVPEEMTPTGNRQESRRGKLLGGGRLGRGEGRAGGGRAAPLSA